MIKIEKDNNEMMVTLGAYENIYKNLGYNIASNVKPKVSKDNEPHLLNNEPISEDDKHLESQKFKGSK